MICCYDVGNEDFEKNGDVILTPKSCSIREVGGGQYELTMVHPVDKEGRWKHLTFGAIVRAPVPVATIQGGAAGLDADVYKVTSAADLQEEPRDAWEPVYYPLWVYGAGYTVGSKVTYENQNYQCIYWEGDSHQITVPPPANNWWKRIPNVVDTGVATLAKLKTNDFVYLMEETSSSWWLVMTTSGIEGYVRTNRLVYDHHEKVEPKPERTITDQPFRIYRRKPSSSSMSVTVYARHITYDLNGVVIGECDISLAKPAMAIMRMKNAWLGTYAGDVVTNLSSEENGTYSGNVTGKTATFGFLDPDKGIVSHFRAQLFRDNRDIYIMKNDVVDRGVRLAYGVNLKGVDEDDNGDKMVTQVIPVAKDEGGNDLYLPEIYVNSELVDHYPVIMQEWLKVDGQVGKEDGTSAGTKWTVESLYEHMREKARERFSVDHADSLNVSVTVNFTLLGDTVEYQQYKGLEKLYMYDLVTVHHPGLDIDLQLQVSEFEWDAIRKRYNSIKLGAVFNYGGRTITGYQIGDGAIDYYKLSQATIDRIIRESR